MRHRSSCEQTAAKPSCYHPSASRKSEKLLYIDTTKTTLPLSPSTPPRLRYSTIYSPLLRNGPVPSVAPQLTRRLIQLVDVAARYTMAEALGDASPHHLMLDINTKTRVSLIANCA